MPPAVLSTLISSCPACWVLMMRNCSNSEFDCKNATNIVSKRFFHCSEVVLSRGSLPPFAAALASPVIGGVEYKNCKSFLYLFIFHGLAHLR